MRRLLHAYALPAHSRNRDLAPHAAFGLENHPAENRMGEPGKPCYTGVFPEVVHAAVAVTPLLVQYPSAALAPASVPAVQYPPGAQLPAEQ